MALKYLKIRNYRSFGDNAIELNNLGKINLLIGTNNSGKSNILRFINLIGGTHISSEMKKIPLNKASTTNTNLPLVIEDFRNFIESKKIEFSFATNDVIRISEDLLPPASENKFISYEIFKESYLRIAHVDNFILHINVNKQRQYLLGQGIHGGSDSDVTATTIERIKPEMKLTFPKAEYLGEFRNLVNNPDLKGKLNSIVNYDHTTQHRKKDKDLLCKYFKDVFGFDVDIKLPRLDGEIQIVIDDILKPLSSLGTGYQQVVLIGLVIITSEAAVLCIDEPELHLHPKAQRALLSLMNSIDKQFIISTHSNHFLDFEVSNKKIYQILYNENGSISNTIENSLDVIKVIDDLGIRPSELYQTNGIIWIEGASDRIYIKKLLELKYPELQEGLQYTFQYYGGKVLSHYSVNDEEFTQYLNILKINRNAFIVMDSDMQQKFQISELRDTKQRIISECAQMKIGYWITEGREIENYLPESLLKRINANTKKRNIFKKLETYCPSYDPKKKVQFARLIENHLTLDDLALEPQLNNKIDEIANEIKRWNN